MKQPNTSGMISAMKKNRAGWVDSDQMIRQQLSEEAAMGRDPGDSAESTGQSGEGTPGQEKGRVGARWCGWGCEQAEVGAGSGAKAGNRSHWAV